MDGSVPGRDAELYRTDEHAWKLRQAAALREQRLSALDLSNLAEFLEDMARSDAREVGARLRVLLVHLLKFQVQPERATRSWAVTVIREQNNLADLLESASLRRVAETLVDKEWDRARREAARETGLPPGSMPLANPFTLDQALSWDPPAEPAKRPGRRTTR